MLSPELLKKIERIYITSKMMVNDIFAGEYESAFRGHGMEFEEVREYSPGDDIRAIDWNVTARMDRPFVKVFREEREQTVMLVVDGSGSQDFGSQKNPKREVVAEIAAILAYAAIKSSDKVGLLIFTDRVERYIPPKKGRGHVWRVISEILSFKPKGVKTNIAEALTYLNKVMHRKSVCFLLSDFFADNFETALRVARFKHDMVALHISDPLESSFPAGGLLTFRDLESGRLVTRDMSSVEARNFYQIARNKERQKLLARFRSMNIDSLFLDTQRDPIHALLEFFKMRERRQ